MLTLNFGYLHNNKEINNLSHLLRLIKHNWEQNNPDTTDQIYTQYKERKLRDLSTLKSQQQLNSDRFWGEGERENERCESEEEDFVLDKISLSLTPSLFLFFSLSLFLFSLPLSRLLFSPFLTCWFGKIVNWGLFATCQIDGRPGI